MRHASPTRRTTSTLALALVLSLGLSACDVVDVVKKLAEAVLSEGVSFSSDGSVGIGGTIKLGGRGEVTFDAGQKVDDAVEDYKNNLQTAINTAVVDGNYTGLTNLGFTGPANDAATLDNSVTAYFDSGVLLASAFTPVPTDVPQDFISDTRPSSEAFPGESGARYEIASDPAKPNLYPGLGSNQRGVVKTFGTDNLPKDEQGRPNGRGAVTYSTFVVYQDPVSKKTTPLFRVGATVYRSVVNGKVQKDSVGIRREVYALKLPTDVTRGPLLTTLGLKAENVDSKPPTRDATSGDYVLGVVSADVSSTVTVLGFNPFSQHFEVGITVKENGTVIFESTPSLPVIPTSQAEYLNPTDPKDWGEILNRFLFSNPISPNIQDPLSPYRKP